MLAKSVNGGLCPLDLGLSVVQAGKVAKVPKAGDLEHENDEVLHVLVLVLRHVADQRANDVPLVITPVESSQQLGAVEGSGEEAPQIRLVLIDFGQRLPQGRDGG